MGEKVNIIDSVVCGDSADLLFRLPAGSIDLVVTSPPYDGLRAYEGFSFDFERIAKGLYHAVKDGGVVVWVVDDETVDGSRTLTSLKQAIYFKEECGFNVHDIMIFGKKNALPKGGKRYKQEYEFIFVLVKGKLKTFNPLMVKSKSVGGGKKYSSFKSKRDSIKRKRSLEQNRVKELHEERRLGNIFMYSVGYGVSTRDKEAYKHPAIFPEQLAYDNIYTWSNPGDIVLDIFSGSGTTVKMAKEMGRHYVGFELSENYCGIANRRLDNTVVGITVDTSLLNKELWLGPEKKKAVEEVVVDSGVVEVKKQSKKSNIFSVVNKLKDVSDSF